MLYSCGNVIVIVIVHLINNWFMMILVAVICVFENKCYEVTLVVNVKVHQKKTQGLTLKDWKPEQTCQVKHKCFNGTIYKKENNSAFD